MKKHLITQICGIVLLFGSITCLAQDKKGIHVIYIGDSITQGVLQDDPASQAPPATACAYLQSYYKSGKMDFSNQGHSGYTTVDFLPGGEAFAELEHATDKLSADHGLLVFSIMLGTNDSAVKGTNGAPVSPESYFNNLRAIVGKLLKDYAGCTIVINHPIWYSPNTYNGAEYLQEGLDRLQSYFPEIKRLAHSYKKSNRGQVFVGDTDAFNYFKETHLTMLVAENGHQGVFYLHPNQKGAKILGEFWAKAIYPHIREK